MVGIASCILIHFQIRTGMGKHIEYSRARPAPDLDGYVPADICIAIWTYFPNFGAAIAFSVLFGIFTIAHLCQAVMYHNGFCWGIIMASLWETGAYAFRALGSKDQQSSGIGLVAQILVLVAPICKCCAKRQLGLPFLTSQQGSMLSRMWSSPASCTSTRPLAKSGLCHLPASLSSLSPLTSLLSVVDWLVQAQVRSHRKTYIGGIGMQKGFIALFLSLVIKFHRDQLQAQRVGRLSADKTTSWRWLMWRLYACLLAITIRIIYRLAEFSAGLGLSNPLPRNEPLLYVLESTLTWLAILVWNVVHPGRFIRGEGAKMPRSWLSRHLCCCSRKRPCDDCRGKIGHAGDHHQRLVNDVGLEEDREMQTTPKNQRGRVAVAAIDPTLERPSRKSSPSGNAREQLHLRSPPAADASRNQF